MTTPGDVLAFWFGPPARSEDELLAKVQRCPASSRAASSAGSPRAFEGDAKAMELVEDAHARGVDRARDLFRRCLADCPPLNRVAFAAGLDQAEKYRAVLLRFGRFPHRNQALGRVSTPEEIEFLKDWDQKSRPAILGQSPAERR